MSSGGLGGAGGLFGGGGTAGGTGGGLFGGSGGATRTSGGLFGGGGTTAAGGTSSGGLFGGTGAGGTTGAGSGIFGGGSTSNPPSGGLFGGAQTTTTTGGGLFSAPATTGGGGLFGGGGGTTATSGGLFGGGPSSGGSGGLFGPSGGTTGATGGLFGGANASTATTGGLFGQASGMNQQGQQQLNPFAHRDFFTGTLILPPTGQPGAQAPLNSQKSFLDKLGPFTVTTLASNQFGRKLNNQGQQKKEKEVNDQADLDKKEKEAFQAELDKLRPIYYNHRIENMNFSSNPLYNKQITSMPEDVQKGILAIDKKIADSSVKLSELKKATADLKNGLKHKLLEMVDERFTKIKALNIKFKMIRQDIGMLNEYVTFFLGIGRDLMLYYESLNIDKVYCLQIPSAALDRITAFVSAYVKSLKQNLDELMVTKEKDPELEATNYVGEFGEVFEHLLSFLLVVINRAVELRAAISRVKARFGLHEQVSYHEPTEHMNEERLDAVNTNIDVLTKMLV